MRAAIVRLVEALAGAAGPIVFVVTLVVEAGCSDHMPVAPRYTPSAVAERSQASIGNKERTARRSARCVAKARNEGWKSSSR